jgi:hypothetical protein
MGMAAGNALSYRLRLRQLDWHERDWLIDCHYFDQWRSLAFAVCPGDLLYVISLVTGAGCAAVAVLVCPALAELSWHFFLHE